MTMKVPPMEETKSLILKVKGAAWLKDQQAKFTQVYGTSVKSADMVMWLIGKQGGLEVTEIKASSGGDEGGPITIAEMRIKGKDADSAAAQGWTKMMGGKIEQPADQAKYSLTGVILGMEEGTTSTGKPRLDLLFTDGTGVCKLVAYADATTLFIEAKVKRGTVVKIPLANAQWGTHDFGKTKNTVWWKFAVPPFGEVIPLEADPRDYFLDADKDVLRDGSPAVMRGFITHIEEKVNTTCTICTRWITEKDNHDKCRQDDAFDTTEETVWLGTATTIAGQTGRLKFRAKPKIKVAVDFLDIFGSIGKNGLEVAFLRRVTPTTPGSEPDAIEEPEVAATPVKAIAKPVKAVTPKPKAKPAPAPVPEPEEDSEESQDEIEEVKAAPVKASPTKAGSDARKAALKAYQEEQAASAPVEESVDSDELEAAPEPVIVRKAAKSPPAAPKPVVQVSAKPKVSPAASEEAEEAEEVPEPILRHIEKSCKQYGGQNRIFVIARTAHQTSLITGDEEASKVQMSKYIDQVVQQGLAEYTTPQKTGIRWVA